MYPRVLINLFWTFEYITSGLFAGPLSANFPDVKTHRYNSNLFEDLESVGGCVVWWEVGWICRLMGGVMSNY